MPQEGALVQSNREAIRWGLLVAAVAVTGYRLPKVVHDFRLWRAAMPIDPSAAELYRVELTVDLVGVAVILCVGLAVFYLLRSPAKNRQ
jgi:hypothetical protein